MCTYVSVYLLPKKKEASKQSVDVTFITKFQCKKNIYLHRGSTLSSGIIIIMVCVVSRLLMNLSRDERYKTRVNLNPIYLYWDFGLLVFATFIRFGFGWVGFNEVWFSYITMRTIHELPFLEIYGPTRPKVTYFGSELVFCLNVKNLWKVFYIP